jgi:hypothetical protein
MSESSGKTHETGFGGHDMGSVQRAGVGAQAADIDDGAHSTGTKLGESGFGAIKRAVQDDRQDITPVTLRHILEGNFQAERCVVDENIDTAETLGSRRHHPVDSVRVGDVSQDRKGSAPTCGDLPDNALRFFMVRAAIDDHGGASRRKFKGDRATDVSTGSSNDRHSPRKLLGVHS